MKALSHGNKVTELVLGQVLNLPSGKLSILCEPQPFLAGQGPSSPTPCCRSTTSIWTFPAEPLNAILCIQSEMAVVPKKLNAWWSQHLRSLKQIQFSTAACTNEEFLMASRQKLSLSLCLWELRLSHANLFLQHPAGPEPGCMHCIRGLLRAPQNKVQKAPQTKASWGNVATGMPDTWDWAWWGFSFAQLVWEAANWAEEIIRAHLAWDEYLGSELRCH